MNILYFLASQNFETKTDIVMFTLIAVVSTVMMIFVGYRLLQIIQLTGYKIKGFFKWFKETRNAYFSRLFMLSFLSCLSMMITNVLMADFFDEHMHLFSYASIIFYILFCSMFIANLFNAKQKTPLKYTKRMMRLLIVFSIIVGLATWGVEYVGYVYIPYLSFSAIAIIPTFLPLFVLVAFYITYPIEKLIANFYIEKAKKKLEKYGDLKIIGITGSYGKTSVKNILATLLSQKFRVCPTPASYNTPLGLAKTVLSSLRKDDEVFIAEMGAKQQNDIAELCQMVSPKIGIITGIGNQHLMTFGSVENIIKTKSELAEFITQNDGKLYINVDGNSARTVAEKFAKSVKIGMQNQQSKVKFENVKTTKSGSEFDIVIGDKRKHVKTILLGQHNISNILLASNVAFDMGLGIVDIARGIEKLHSIAHRLDIIKSSSKYTIIDDAYNSSVEGSKASLEVLSVFSGKKFVITPGLVELGQEQFNCNFEFGRDMSKICDYVIIDSAINFDAISSGLIFAGFDESHIYQASNLSQAVKVLNTLVLPDDVVLFENDLPDNYS